MRPTYNPTMSSADTIPAWNEAPRTPLEPARRFERVTTCSPFAAGLLQRYPEWREALDEHEPPTPGELAEMVAHLGLDVALRRFRNRRMLRIIWRDLCGLASLDETFADLTSLAEVTLAAALETHTLKHQEQFGRPEDEAGIDQQLAVIALGKFGGGELNLSSDIDIIFCYGNDGECTGGGKRKLTNEEFFSRVARAAIASLSEVTADGFCFRVDTRLRPFGEAGPLCSSLAALEKYYQREGRDWERYALIKARPVAGPESLGVDLMNRVRPFVYRRYIDFTAIEALQDMHASVSEDARRRDRLQDIKRGPGGIREIEFLVQCFQLLRGGREPLLQTPSLRRALAGIAELSLLSPADVEGIRSDYVYLRQLENRIQALHDQQTHELPGGDDLQRLSVAMACEGPAELNQRLEGVRHSVAERFQAIFPNQRAAPAAVGAEPHWAEVWRRLQAERQQGDEGPEALEDRPLSVFLQSLERLALSQRAQRRLDQFMPVLLHRLDRLDLPDRILHQLFDLVLAISQRSPYLVLLVQNAAALDRLVELFARSEWIASRVIRFPALLDELIDPSLGQQIPLAEDLQRSIDRILRTAGETEAVLEGLNYLKLATSLRIAVAQLEGLIESTAAQAALAELAGALLRGLLELASTEIAARHGRLPGPNDVQPGTQVTGGNSLAIIAYGSLGAFEPGYESDLDIVFLFAGSDSASDGVRPLPAERYYARLAQRLLSFLTAMTHSGRLYAVDTRLRPNGRAGALVSSLESFAEYQRKEAWTWELQALTRARFLAGDAATGSAFESIRDEVLRHPRALAPLREDLAAMRQKMVHELGEHPGDEAAPKHQPGGLVDIEFIVQLGVLATAATHPPVIESTATARQLQELERSGWMSREDAATLGETARALHRQRMLHVLAPGEPQAAIDTHPAAALFEKLVGNPGAVAGASPSVRLTNTAGSAVE